MRMYTRNGAALAGLVLLLCFTIIADAAPTSIRTGSDITANGYLEVQPDEYGAWAANFTGAPFGPNADRFKPSTSTLQVTAFTSGFFLFGPSGQRELLSDNTNWQNVNNGTTGAPTIGSDTSLNRAVTAPNISSDTNGDGVPDTLNSAFRVFAPGGGTDLGFNLQQQVRNVSPSVSFISQNYTVTNNGTAPITITMVRTFDGDLLWDNNFESDSVGTGANADPGGPFVFMQEVGQPTQGVTLSIEDGSSYYGGKHGVTPPLGTPAMDFGTDTEVWDANGVPTSWEDFIAGVGYNIDGQSGPAPPGSTTPRDAFMGVDLTLTLNPGQSSSFSVLHTYGQNTPVPEPAAMVLALGAVALLMRSRRAM